MGPRLQIAAIFICGAIALPAAAFTGRMMWINELTQVSLAIENYETVLHRLPHDIIGADGKPLLSWRVAVLPFVEHDNLYKKFRLHEPWDSLTNDALSAEPNPFRHRWSYKAETLTGVVIPRGPGTFWGDGGKRTLKDVKGDPARTILLVEVAEDAAPVWTEPRDLRFDPENPRNGLGWHWPTGFSGERSCFAIFADGKVRLLSGLLSDEQLRGLFSGECTHSLVLNWYETATQVPGGWGILPTFAVGLLAIVGGLATTWRLIGGRTVSPGESLWLVLGMEYLVFLTTFMTRFEYSLLSSGYWVGSRLYMDLVLPARLAGLAMCVPAWLGCARRPAWWVLWAGFFALMSLACCDALVPDMMRCPEHALVTMPAPFVMAVTGFIAILLTWVNGLDPACNQKLHWAGVFACFVPLIWFCVWWNGGYAYHGSWFVRIRE